MSSRASVYVIESTPCNGGVSPNAYVAHITVEIRIFYPPVDGNIDLALIDLDQAYQRAREQLVNRKIEPPPAGQGFAD